MAKSIHVKDDVRLLIADIHVRNPEWGPKKVHEELMQELDRTGHREKFCYPRNWPDVSTVGKELRTIKPEASKTAFTGQDEKWSLGTLDKYALSTDTIPAVLAAWKLRTERGETLTIREAKWAARLSAVLKDTETLSSKASQYARAELLFALIGCPFDSTGLDRLLMGLPLNLTTDLTSFFPLLSETEDAFEEFRESAKPRKRSKGGKGQ